MRKERKKERRSRPDWVTDIAKERISILFDKAFSDPARKKRYLELARTIGMRYNVRLPKEYKRKFCKKCYESRFRIRVFSRGKYVLYTCLNCGEKYRYPYGTKK